MKKLVVFAAIATASCSGTERGVSPFEMGPYQVFLEEHPKTTEDPEPQQEEDEWWEEEEFCDVGCDDMGTDSFGQIDAFPFELAEAPSVLEDPNYRPWSAGQAIAATEDEVFAVDSDNDMLVVVDRTENEVVRAIEVAGRPEQVVVGPDGTAWITAPRAGTVSVVTPGRETIATMATVGVEPFGLALAPEINVLYVTLRAEGALLALDASTLKELARVDGLNQPRAVAVHADGHVTVTRRGDTALVVSLDAEKRQFSVGPTAQLRTVQPADLFFRPQRTKLAVANRAMGVAIDPVSDKALVLHHSVVQLDKGTMAEAAFNIAQAEEFNLDPDELGGGYGAAQMTEYEPIDRKLEFSVTKLSTNGAVTPAQKAKPIRDGSSGQPMTNLIAVPWSISMHPSWSLAFVTGLGSDTVLVLNTAVQDPMRSPIAAFDTGWAPKGVAFSPDGETAYVLNAHAYTVSRLDLRPLMQMPIVTEWALGHHHLNAASTPFNVDAKHVEALHLKATHPVAIGQDPFDEKTRLGRRLFTNATSPKTSHGGEFACAGCHIDGGEDALVWPTSSGGLQTPALAARLSDTAPFNWKGGGGGLTANMAETIQRLGGEGLTEPELEQLEAFLLTGMEPPVNPNLLPGGGLTPAQERGRTLFFDPVVGCSSCHAGPALTDGLNHNVGTATDLELDIADFMGQLKNNDTKAVTHNTPSLRDVFATAPYLHDGSAKTLYDVLIQTEEKMGYVGDLDQSQLLDLVDYMKTL